MSSVLYILLALVLLGALIAIHEFGHFMAARICGIPVKEYSIGFGPCIFRHKSKKSGTLYALRPIPLGGYCMFYGESASDTEECSADDPRNYNNAAAWKRMLSVIAGPLMNAVLAFFLAVIMMAGYASKIDGMLISQVTENSPAAECGIQAGDRILSIGETDLNGLSYEEMVAVLNTFRNGNSLPLKLLRGSEILEVAPSYFMDEETGDRIVGVYLQPRYVRTSFAESIPAAWNMCLDFSTQLIRALGKMFTTGEGLKEASGPVGIVSLVAEQTRQNGFGMYLYLAALISMNLGIMNMLPIPGLDGSRLLFLLFEAIFRKPVNRKVETIIYLTGYALLIGFMLYITVKDVLHLIH